MTYEKDIFKIDWSKDFHLGVEEIDKQHEELAAHVNKMYDLYVRIDTTEAELVDAINHLMNLFESHFESEYALFKSYEVSNLQDQEIEHTKLLDEMRAINGKASPILVKTIFINQLLLYYLKEHLLEEDMISINEVKDKMNNSENLL